MLPANHILKRLQHAVCVDDKVLKRRSLGAHDFQMPDGRKEQFIEDFFFVQLIPSDVKELNEILRNEDRRIFHFRDVEVSTVKVNKVRTWMEM